MGGRRIFLGERAPIRVGKLGLQVRRLPTTLEPAKGAKGVGFQLLGAAVVRHQCRIPRFRAVPRRYAPT